MVFNGGLQRILDLFSDFSRRMNESPPDLRQRVPAEISGAYVRFVHFDGRKSNPIYYGMSQLAELIEKSSEGVLRDEELQATILVEGICYTEEGDGCQHVRPWGWYTRKGRPQRILCEGEIRYSVQKENTNGYFIGDRIFSKYIIGQRKIPDRTGVIEEIPIKSEDNSKKV